MLGTPLHAGGDGVVVVGGGVVVIGSKTRSRVKEESMHDII